MQETINLTNKDFFSAPPDLGLPPIDYAHPAEVIQDDRLDPAKKRAILSAWASDACAVSSRPQFRWLRGTPGPILVDHVLAALRALDGMTGLQIPREDASMLRQPRKNRLAHLSAAKGTGLRLGR